MDITYFQKINNLYESKSKQETDLYLLNRHVDYRFDDTIDYDNSVKRNGSPFELLIIKDTENNTFKKKIKSKNSAPFYLGDYIEWNNQIWLVTLLDTNDKTYHSGYMYLCTVPLRWQNEKGDIIERWAYSEDFTKYSSGVSRNRTYTVGDNQYGLTLPIDEETRKLNRDMRFVIDFDDSQIPDVYKLTNRKVMLNNNEYFGKGGTMVGTMSLCQFDKDNDKKVTYNDKSVWICDYKSVDKKEEDDSQYEIIGDDELFIGEPTTYCANFDNSLLSWDSSYSWNVIFNCCCDIQINKNEICLLVEDEGSVNEKLKIQLLKNDLIVKEKTITIKSIF